MGKTVNDIQNWFNSEVKEVISETPQRIIEIAKNDKGMRKILAENIARKKCFKVNAVMEYLNSYL